MSSKIFKGNSWTESEYKCCRREYLRSTVQQSLIFRGLWWTERDQVIQVSSYSRQVMSHHHRLPIWQEVSHLHTFMHEKPWIINKSSMLASFESEINIAKKLRGTNRICEYDLFTYSVSSMMRPIMAISFWFVISGIPNTLIHLSKPRFTVRW